MLKNKKEKVSESEWKFFTVAGNLEILHLGVFYDVWYFSFK